MSDLTQCNYCTLRGIRRRAKAEGKKVFVRYNAGWGMGGTNIYAVPKGVYLPEGGIVEDSEFHRMYSVAWLMEITSTCAC